MSNTPKAAQTSNVHRLPSKTLVGLLPSKDYARLTGGIKNLEGAKAFIEVLVRNNLLFPFEDSVYDVDWREGVKPTRRELHLLNARMSAVYGADFDWDEDEGCPIGYALKLVGTAAEVTYIAHTVGGYITLFRATAGVTEQYAREQAQQQVGVMALTRFRKATEEDISWFEAMGGNVNIISAEGDN